MNQIHICIADDMHPYNCLGAGDCIHCDKKSHNVEICALCADSIPDIDDKAEADAERVIRELTQ